VRELHSRWLTKPSDWNFIKSGCELRTTRTEGNSSLRLINLLLLFIVIIYSGPVFSHLIWP
jgi:hypothetical protein